MKTTSITLTFAALAATVLAKGEPRQEYMYFPSVTAGANLAAPTCVVHANNAPCSAGNTKPEQVHNVSGYGLTLHEPRSAIIPGEGSVCYNLQQSDHNLVSGGKMDSNKCPWVIDCPSVPMTSLWFMNNDCAAPDAGGRGLFRTIMAFTNKDCQVKDGDVWTWDMGTMAKKMDVMRSNTFAHNYCVMFGDHDGGPPIASFQVLTEGLVE